MFEMRKIFTNSTLKRYFCNEKTSTYVLEHLKKKSLISVVGEEAQSYLQGLITNDINHLSNNLSSLYAMFLNSKGRVLYDSIIYRIDSKKYFVECEETLAHSLEKHLKMYRLRRKVDVFLNNYQIHVIFDDRYFSEILKNKRSSCDLKQNLDISILDNPSLKIFRDPRVSQLGYRILSEEGIDVQSQLLQLLDMNIDNRSSLSYRKHRYSLGIGEGAADIPFGSCFPLESNCDYLHGVSFHKGCYIGQELTARTHHTGVTRKRLMPLYFNKNLDELPSEDLLSNNNVKLGKLRGFEGNVGLALLRLESIIPNSTINIAGTEAVVCKPFWWPIKAPKQIQGMKK